MEKEVFFDTHAEARVFAQNLLATNESVAYIRIGKKRNGPLWSVIYHTMSKQFMEKYKIEG